MVKIRQILKSYKEISTVALDILLYRFPGFVYGQKLDGEQIPCFCYHSVEPEEFEKVLKYLTENHYDTLSINSFYRILKGQEKLQNPKSVLLTFDDGTGSMWTTLYPLLKKYDFKATVFIVPGRIEYQKEYLPNLDDVWENRASMNDISSRDESDTPLATWEEIKIMHDSGLIDFESHTLDHSLIFTSPKIIDFVNPKLLTKFHPFEFPMIRNDETSVESINHLGMPLYTTAPRMSDYLRYIDNRRLREACINYVNERGGEIFFREKNWKNKMLNYVSKYHLKSGHSYNHETKDQQKKAIAFELKRSKELIEEHLVRKRVQHLCYPWGIAGRRATEIAKKIGYISSFSQERNRKENIGQNIFRINRIGEDFIFCLPGRKSDTLKTVLKKKILRRIKQGSPYLSH